MLGLVPYLFAFGGYAMEKYLKNRLTWINYAVLFLSVCSSLLALPYGLPVLSFEKLEKYAASTNQFLIYPFYRWEDGKVHPVSQPYSDMTGWDELATLVAKAYHQLPKEEQARCTIFGERNYGYAGAIHFYGKKYHLPDAITFHDSYILWAPDTIPQGPIVYIFYNRGEMNNLFAKVDEIGTIENKYFRENGLKVFLCQQPLKDIQPIYKYLAQEAKRTYRRN